MVSPRIDAMHSKTTHLDKTMIVSPEKKNSS